MSRAAWLGRALLISCVVGATAGLLASTRQSVSIGPGGASAPVVQRAREALAQGRFDEVDTLLGAGDPTDVAAVAVRAHAAIARGRYGQAEGWLTPASARAPISDATLELGLLQLTLGRRAEGALTLEALFSSVSDGATAADYARAARAARALGVFQQANRSYRAAAAAAPEDPAINTGWGELFLDKHNRQDAVRSFQAALRSDPNWAMAHLGLARAVAEDDPPRARASAARALAINPALVDAHLFVAELALNEGHVEQARAAIDRALATNPSSLDARARLAAIAHLDGREADFRAEVARALAINPSYGEIYRVAGDHAARHYRFDEAVTLTRRAIELDADNPRAHADLGIHLLRTGDETGARDALERAFRRDPYDVVTYNLLGLLDTLDTFETVREGDLIVRLHPDEAAVLREYVLPLAQDALRTLSARYEFAPRGPILVEVFPRHDDFAVRNVGLPGMIGALGACFGRVITMDSPRARPPGAFNWGATLWHEMAHVITLQMSNQRVPRWLTEGISVYEETRARPEWGREMEITFAHALDRGDVRALRDLNAGFTSPETIALAYYQASLVVEHVVASYGEAALRRLLRAYGEGLNTEAAMKQALGITLDRLQATFTQALDARFGAIRRVLRAPDGLASLSLDALKALAAAQPHSYPVQLALGQALRRAGEPDEALRALDRAAALLPMATGKDSPRRVMAEIALERNDGDRASAELERLLAHDHTDLESARTLAGLLDPRREPARAAVAHERVVAIDPFDVESNRALGRLALERRDAEEAGRRFRVALAAGPVDRAAAHCDLAESYLLGGRRVEAKRQALAALEIAPTYARAQDLLLKVTEERP